MKLDQTGTEAESVEANANKTLFFLFFFSTKVDLFSFVLPSCLKSGKAKSISMTVYSDTLPRLPPRSGASSGHAHSRSHCNLHPLYSPLCLRLILDMLDKPQCSH